MEKIEQENSQELQQENFLDGKTTVQATALVDSEENELKTAQLVPPKETFDKIAELECQYREIVEQENK